MRNYAWQQKDKIGGKNGRKNQRKKKQGVD